jgi:hypothetical protein
MNGGLESILIDRKSNLQNQLNISRTISLGRVRRGLVTAWTSCGSGMWVCLCIL